jgi:hypothetical protein
MPDGDPPHKLPRAAALARTELIPQPDAAPPQALLLCPECDAAVAAADFETHLRTAHRVYLFRGARRSYNDTLAVLLDLLAAPRPDPGAWRTLAALAREDHGPRADFFLAASLGRALARLDDDRRPAAVGALSLVLAEDGWVALTAALAADDETAARGLALAVMARRPPPFDPALVQPLRALLLDRRLPVEAQFAALDALLRSSDSDGPLVAEMLQKLVGGLGKKRSIERLREFEKVAGPTPAVEALCAELEERLRMSCPRCPVELRRPDMVRHLWAAHRLLLDARRVREPWPVLEEAVAKAREENDPELVERCRALAREADPADGPARLGRLLLRHGLGDAASRRALADDARARHASLCPWCYGLVPRPREAPPPALSLRPGRLFAGGYGVEISEYGLRPRLDVRAPGRVVYAGREPGRRWTGRAIAALLALPPMSAALAAACGLFGAGPPLAATAVWLLAAGLTYAAARFAWRPRAGAELVLRHAWDLLAPRLHPDGFSPDDSAFLAALAAATPAGAFRDRRAPLLAALAKRAEDAVAAGLAPPDHLAALRRLQAADAAAAGADPVPLVADALARCFDGRLPLEFAERLLADWRAAWWTPGALARLRVLLCDRAFEAGFEVRNLLDAGRSAPALGAVLGTDDPAALAALRLLWARRPLKPWDHCGPALTAFDLAADPAQERLLGDNPDLLLWQREPAWLVAADGDATGMAAAEVRVGASGVCLQGVYFASQPRTTALTRKEIGWELDLGGRAFRSSDDLDALARRMERWFRYFFQEFRAEAASVPAWASPDRAVALRTLGAAACPDCGRFLLPRVGEVGVALDEAASR